MRKFDREREDRLDLAHMAKVKATDNEAIPYEEARKELGLPDMRRRKPKTKGQGETLQEK